MKTLIPILLLYAAVPALCQSSLNVPGDPDQPSQFQLQRPDFSAEFALENPLIVMPSSRILSPAPKKQLGSSQVDSPIIHRPSPSEFVQAPPRIPLAHDLYPDLKLQPIQIASLENIPAFLFKLKIVPAPGLSPGSKTAPLSGTKPCKAQRK